MDLKKLRKINLEETKKKIKESVKEDDIIIQITNSLDELDKIINSVSMRFRDFLKLKNPEAEATIHDSKKLAELFLKDELSKTIMGKNLDSNSLKEMAKMLISLSNTKKTLQKELEDILEVYAPNLKDLAGVQITSKLLREARSLKRLSMMPSSTIQLLGAEDALFRHLRTGARSPKYGFLLSHQVVQNAKNKGKMARALASKLTIAARLDYHKGERMAIKYLSELENARNK